MLKAEHQIALAFFETTYEGLPGWEVCRPLQENLKHVSIKPKNLDLQQWDETQQLSFHLRLRLRKSDLDRTHIDHLYRAEH